jgi:predicted membrane metal-binding protein
MRGDLLLFAGERTGLFATHRRRGPHGIVCGRLALMAQNASVFLVALLCALGVLAAKVGTGAGTQMVGAEIPTRLTGRIVSLDRMANGRIRLTIDAISTARPALRYMPKRIRASAMKIPPGAAAGSKVTGYVRLLPPTGPVQRRYWRQRLFPWHSKNCSPGWRFARWCTACRASSLSGREPRESIADHIRGSIGGAEGEIAAALVVGVRAGIPEEINEAMRRTGIYHIISISGLHMALVAGTVMGLLRGAFALFPDFSSRRPVKKYAAAAALFSIAAYLIISGVVVAAERSFIMLAVMLISCCWTGRRSPCAIWRSRRLPSSSSCRRMRLWGRVFRCPSPRPRPSSALMPAGPTTAQAGPPSHRRDDRRSASSHENSWWQ